MAATYTLEDHVSHLNIIYKLDKTSQIAYYAIGISIFFQVFVLWILIGGGEAFLGIRLSNTPLKVIDYWIYVVLGLFVMDVIMMYVLGWAMIAERNLKVSPSEIIFTSKLFSLERVKTLALNEIEEFFVKEDRHKNSISYQVGVLMNKKPLGISASLSEEDAKALVSSLNMYKTKHQPR